MARTRGDGAVALVLALWEAARRTACGIQRGLAHDQLSVSTEPLPRALDPRRLWWVLLWQLLWLR